MLFTIEHVYCGQIKIIAGYSFADACKKADIMPRFWNIIDIEFLYD
jgi:hypothetical protein